MSQAIRVGIVGGGWPGHAHAKGYQASGGFKLVAVADLIPDRRKKMMSAYGITTQYADAAELIANRNIDAVSVCLPNHLHVRFVVEALRAGKHVVCETPPALTVREARQIDSAAEKNSRVVLYAAQRRWGSHEQAAHQAIAKGYLGEVYHARTVWTRTRGIPLGTGWYTHKERSGGGAMIDVGLHMLDLAWYLMGKPAPISVYGVAHQRFAGLVPADVTNDVEDAAFAIIRFENGKSLELASSWAINQPPNQNGTVCRIYGQHGAVEVYTPAGPVVYRLGPKAEMKHQALKGPKTAGHHAMMRHFRDCILGKSQPLMGSADGIVLMQMIDAYYKSIESNKTIHLSPPKSAGASLPRPAAPAANQQSQA
jgi:predicted dehydrogenase